MESPVNFGFERTGEWPVKALLIAGLILPFYAGAQASLFEVNLLANPDAEAGPASENGYASVPVPGWETNGGFTVVAYTAGGGFPVASDPCPANRGMGFFAGGPSGSPASASQFIDISAAAAEVDQGRVTCVLSGFLGGYATQNDRAVLVASFLGTTSNMLGSVAIGPVTAEDREGQTGMFYRRSTALLASGTRYVTVLLQMSRWDGSYNDGYADNLSLVMQPYRPPLSIELLPGQARLSWPTNDGAFQLETTVNLNGALPWTNWITAPALVGGTFVVTNAIDEVQRFFRLKK